MERHVDLLATLSTLWGALTILLGVSTMLLAVGALAAVVGPSGERLAFAAGLTAAAFALAGGFALLWGGAHVWAGALLRRRLPSGRMLSLGLAIINLLAFPFGTGLGTYALWVLLKNDGRRLFEGTIPVAASR